MKPRYRVGCAKADITPPLGIPYLGHVPRHAPIRAVHDPLFARATCIEAGTDRVIVISADTIGFADTLLGQDRSFVGEVKREIELATGTPGSHVMLASNHIHSSPETLGFRPLSASYPEAHSWLEGLQATLVSCATAACRDSVKANLRIGRGAAPGLSYNRRSENCVDEEIVLLRFDSARGPEVLLVNYGCHPVVVQAQELASADYVGAMVAAVEARLSGLRSCQFLLGACGDLDPSVRVTRRFSNAEDMGQRLAEEVLRTAKGAEADSSPPTVRGASQVVTFPSRPLPPAEETQDEEALVRLAEGSGPFRGEVQVLRVGGAVLVGLPGEVFCGTGLALKRLAQPLTGLPVTCANGYLGYMAPPEAWEAGGYEVELGPWSKVGPEAPSLLLAAVRALLPEVG